MKWLSFLPRMVQGSDDADKPDGGPEFAQVFVIVWMGAAVVTMNTKLLGGTMWVPYCCNYCTLVVIIGWYKMPLQSCILVWRLEWFVIRTPEKYSAFTTSGCMFCRSFFQSVCVLGYCLMPSSVSLILCRLILFMQPNKVLVALRLIVTCIGFIWATFGKSY